jgi:linoleoyl-CoA desaturase
MERVRVSYAVQNKKEFIVELRGKVVSYFEKNKISQFGNLNLYIKTGFMILLYFSPYFLMLTGIIQSFAGVVLCWITMGIGKAGIGMAVMHDANHKSYSHKKWVNKWMGNTLYLLGGSPITWQYQHNTLHHGFTNIEGLDEDIDPGSLLRFSPHKPLLRIHRYQYIYAWILYGLMTLSWVTTKDFKQLIQYKKEGGLGNKMSTTQLWMTLIVTKLMYYGAFVLIPMLVLPFAWYWVIVFFLIMHYTSGFILTVIFQTAHVVPTSEYPLPDENGMLENNWAVHQLFTTSDFAPMSRVFSWFIGGLNYQVEHHLFPNISHVHYRKLSKLVEEMADKYHLPYYVQPGFLRALREHGRMLKKLGRTYSI